MSELPVIDCDADPFVPEGWRVLSHKKDGQFTWDMNKVGVFTPACQNGIIPPVGNEVEEALKDVPVLNANILDFLVANPEHASIEALSWMDEGEYKGCIFFWGTIYADEEGNRAVRGLTLENGVLGWGSLRIDHDGLLGEYNPAAVLEEEEKIAA